MYASLAERPNPAAAAAWSPTPPTPPLAAYAAYPTHPFAGNTPSPLNPLLRQVLDVMAHALVLVDDDALVLHANAAARAQCRPGAPVVLDGRRLCLAGGPERRLQAAIRTARGGQWSMLTVHGQNGPNGQKSQSASIAVVPVGGMRQGGEHDDVAALLVLGSCGGPSALALQFFCQTFELTNAEKAVLESLCKGLAPTQIAAAGSVAVCTVRTHITAIRQKAQASSIGHLMHLVSSLPPLASAA